MKAPVVRIEGEAFDSKTGNTLLLHCACFFSLHKNKIIVIVEELEIDRKQMDFYKLKQSNQERILNAIMEEMK